MSCSSRAMRADAERTHHQILSAAQQVLSADPAASMADIAKVAGVARTTVHRRFATREALVEAMSEWSARRVYDVFAEGGSDSAPPLVALYQVTAQVLKVKIDLPELSHQAAPSATTVKIQSEMAERCRELLCRVQNAGVLRPDVDLDWARRVFYALIHEVIDEDEANADVLATRVVDTLLRGVGTGASL